jgi:hypothetical protein
MSCRQHRSRATVLFLGRPQVADRPARPVRRGRAAHRAYDVTGDDPSRLVVNADHRRQRGPDRRRLDAERQLLFWAPRGAKDVSRGRSNHDRAEPGLTG